MAKPAAPQHKAEQRRFASVPWGPLAAIAGTFLIYFGSMLFGSILLGLVAGIFGYSGERLARWVEETGPQFMYILFVEVAVFGMLWFFLKMRKARFSILGFRKPQWHDLGYALMGFAIYLPVLIATMLFVRAFIPGVNLEQEQQIGFEAAKGFGLILVFISLVVLPPLAEETLSRGFLYLGLRTKLPIVAAAIVTSIIFAIAHLQFGSGAPLLWSAAIDTFILSLVLVFVREKTNALWAPIGLHAIKNGLAFSVLFIFT